MKRKQWLLFLVCACIASGCGQESAKDEHQAENEQAGEEEQEIPEELQDGGAAEQEEGSGEEKAETEELTAEELEDFTEYMCQMDRYGFLLSSYEDARKVDLQELFYSGAGIRNDQLSEKEEKAYLKATGMEEIYTDVVKLTQGQIDKFLKDSIGYGYGDMEHSLEWTYLPEYDAYYQEAGDTNYEAFTCVSGNRTGNTYVLDFMRENAELYGEYISRLTLEEKDGSFLIRSNQYLPCEDRIIAEQSFYEVEMEPQGTVDFLAIAPDVEENELLDVTFQIWQDGKPVERLFGPEPGLARAALIFREVKAVSFTDFNQDGYTDAIIILDYDYAREENLDEAYTEVRLYSGSEYGLLIYEEELSDALTNTPEEQTISTVKEFLGM